jgi:glucose-1-phosphate adenylyltransferase
MSTNDRYRGKLENLYYAWDFLECGPKDEYVVMADSAILSNMDLTKVLNAHVASGKDITVVTKAGIANGSKQLDLAVKLDGDGNIQDIAVDYVAPADYLASMDTFVLSKKFLKHQIKELVARDRYHMDRDLVMNLYNKGFATINIYPFDGVALFNESVEEYFVNSLRLLDREVRHDLFGRNHPVYTKVRDRVPSYYGEYCEIENCLVADGCFLEGEAEDSVLFRQVTIAENAEVENCVIMNDSVVGAGAKLEYVILDKNVTVRPGARLVGTEKNPIIIKRGETV